MNTKQLDTMPAGATFTEAHLAKLRAEFGKIKSASPDCLPKMHAILDQLSDAALVQVANAKISFLSGIARNDCVRRGLDPRSPLEIALREYEAAHRVWMDTPRHAANAAEVKAKLDSARAKYDAEYKANNPTHIKML